MSMFDTLYRWKMYCNFSMSHANIFIQAYQTFLIQYVATKDPVLSALLVIGGVLSFAVAGYWGVERRGYLRRQNTIANRHNREIMRAARRRK